MTTGRELGRIRHEGDGVALNGATRNEVAS